MPKKFLSKKQKKNKRKHTKKVYRGGNLGTNMLQNPEVMNNFIKIVNEIMSLVSNKDMSKNIGNLLATLKSNPSVTSIVSDIGSKTAELIISKPEIMQVLQVLGSQYKLLNKPEIQEALNTYVMGIIPHLSNNNFKTAITSALGNLPTINNSTLEISSSTGISTKSSTVQSSANNILSAITAISTSGPSNTGSSPTTSAPTTTRNSTTTMAPTTTSATSVPLSYPTSIPSLSPTTTMAQTTTNATLMPLSYPTSIPSLSPTTTGAPTTTEAPTTTGASTSTEASTSTIDPELLAMFGPSGVQTSFD